MDPSRAPRPAREPSVARETAEDIAEDLKLLAKGTAELIVDDARSRVAAMVLLVLMVPVGIIVLIISFLAMASIYAFVGAPSGPVGSVVTIVWLLATLAALFLVFRVLYRRMPGRLRTAYADPMEQGPREPSRASLTRPEGQSNGPAAASPAPTLAELDARLGPTPQPPDRPS